MNTTIYTIKTNPNANYGHDGATQEQIDVFDSNIHNVLKGSTNFIFVDSRNESTDSYTDIYATSADITISHGSTIEIEPHDEDSNICDLTIDFIELVTMRGGYDPYITFNPDTLNFLTKAIDSWFDRFKQA